MKTERKGLSLGILSLTVALSAFQFYTAAVAPLQATQQRSMHLLLILPLGFLYEAARSQGGKLRRAGILLLALSSAAACLYSFVNWLALQNRTTQLVPPDYVFAVILILAILILTWRSIGLCMPAIACVFILYAFTGQYLGGVFSFSAISLRRFVSSLYCGTEGIFGACLGAASTYVFMFIVFGEFLSRYGAGDFFIRLSEAAFGRMRGSSGKIAIITSALFGMISGSPTANVAATGCLTIPMMKKSGYSAEYAGGIAAAASAGGSIAPPVMGTGAFVMAEIIGISYGDICLAATLPALLYFLSLFIMVDVNAVKNRLPRTDAARLSLWEALRDGWHYLASILVLFVFLIVLGWSPAKSSVLAVGTLFACDCVKAACARKQIDFSKFTDALMRACKSAVPIAAVTACAGIIIGCFNATGLNLRLSSMLIELSGGSTIALLIFAAIGALVLGMGLPATPVYILMAVMIAPALTRMGISRLAAHMFVFYYGAMAPITPPVGTAFYVAAGLAKASPMRTGLTAWYTALVAFLLPFVWVYAPAFLLEGTALEILWVASTSLVGTAALAFGLEGYLLGRIGPWKRGGLLCAAIMLVVPELVSSLAGTMLLLLLAATQYLKGRCAAPKA